MLELAMVIQTHSKNHNFGFRGPKTFHFEQELKIDFFFTIFYCTLYEKDTSRFWDTWPTILQNLLMIFKDLEFPVEILGRNHDSNPFWVHKSPKSLLKKSFDIKLKLFICLLNPSKWTAIYVFLLNTWWMNYYKAIDS